MLGVFLDVYGLKLSDNRMVMPAAEGSTVYDIDDKTLCDGKDLEIKVVAWDNYNDTGKGVNYITDLNSVSVSQDGMVMAIVVAEKGAEIGMPPHAADLPDLGAADGGEVPSSATTLPGDTGTTSTTGG